MNTPLATYLLEEKEADPNIHGECQYASQPTMALTYIQGEFMEQHSMWLRRLGVLKLSVSSLERGQMLILWVSVCVFK